MKNSLLLVALSLVGSACAMFTPRPPAPLLGPNLAAGNDAVAVTFPKTGFSARIATPNSRYFVRVREAASFGSVDFFEKANFAQGVEPTATQSTPNISFYVLKVETRSTDEWVRAAKAKAHTLATIRDSDDGRGGHELMTTVYVPGYNGRKDFRYVRLLKVADGYIECGGSTGGEALAKETEAFCASIAPAG